MPTSKFAISIEETLFKEIEAFYRSQQISRSQFFAKAAREFIQKHTQEEILETLNEVYSNPKNQPSNEVLEGIGECYEELIEVEW